MLGGNGRVYPVGDAVRLGEPIDLLGPAEAVALEATPSGNGYSILSDAGQVFAYGDAKWYGNADPAALVAGERAISLSRTRSGNGYWIFTTGGRALPYGDAKFYGDLSRIKLNGPVLDSVPTASGNGYYMVASDGGVFSFG